MPGEHRGVEGMLSISASLDVAAAIETHAKLLAALDASAAREGEIVVDLDGDVPGPLALQLLASAVRSFPAARLRLGDTAAAAMTAFELPKEN